MKILHTSDWHLGRSLYGQKRYAEFDETLDWLADLIQAEQVDALLISGDLFDTSNPTNRAREQYYKFIAKMNRSGCRNIVVVAGNHDSPSFLTAPKEVLRELNVHVIGQMSESAPDDEIILLRDDAGRVEAIICAVPYLRDQDIRKVEAGETSEMKTEKLVAGIADHYRQICSRAEEKRNELVKLEEEKTGTWREIPIIVMGHLFASGGKCADDDGVRELYVGTLAEVDQTIFPSSANYVALGHLHIPQIVGGQSHIRYSGSLLPIGFDEAVQKKQVVLVEFDGVTPAIREEEIPRFHDMERITGSFDEIAERIENLKQMNSDAFLEIVPTEYVPDLNQALNDLVAGSSMVICRIRFCRKEGDHLLTSTEQGETLNDLDEYKVFTIRLDEEKNMTQEDKESLTLLYREIVQSIYEEDTNAE